MDNGRLTCAAAARVQFVIAIACLAVGVATFAGLSAAANDERLAASMDRAREKDRRRTKEIFSHSGYYVDFWDRLLLDEIPAADYSNGGVYLIGSSNVVWSTKFWELPGPEQALIHNYGMGACNHAYQFQLLQFLIERRQLLRAGGEKTLVVFGVSHHAAAAHDDVNPFFPECWQRHGLYQYDPERGVQDVPITAVERWLRTERIRIGGFLTKWHENLWMRFDRWRNDFPPPAVREHDRAKILEFWRTALGPNWEADMRTQVQEFARMIDYLLAREVNIVVVQMPLGSWEQRLPYASAYTEQISEVCRTRQITLHDCSGILNDDDFADSSHLNLFGMEKFQPIILDLARAHLRKTEALP